MRDCGGVHFLQNVCSSEDFLGLTSNSIFWSLFYVEKKNLAFTTNLNCSRVCAHVNAFLSMDMLDPKNVDSGIWML